MEDHSKITVSIIGLGLIGGSIAKALKDSGRCFTIKALDRPEVCAKALNDKTIDSALDDPEASADSDIIFICLPVELSLKAFEKLSPIVTENTIITDVCGIKGAFEDTWQKSRSKGIYIGGHPMTGKEKGGYENSDPLLFENAVYIISSKAEFSPQIDFFLDVIHIMGARTVFLDPYLHDNVVANVSHLPQLLSVALVNSAGSSDKGVNNLDFAAGGFRDMTRIASSSFNIWDSVIKHNRQEILSAISQLQSELDKIKSLVETLQTDKLEELFASAAARRDQIPKNNKGFINTLYDISVFVKDEPGIVSRISTALYKNGINIKDIELLKIREGSGGTFRMSFSSLNEADLAKDILRSEGFQVS